MHVNLSLQSYRSVSPGSSLVLIICACNIISNHIISTDEDPGLRIESFAVINLRGVSTNNGIITVFNNHRGWCINNGMVLLMVVNDDAAVGDSGDDDGGEDSVGGNDDVGDDGVGQVMTVLMVKVVMMVFVMMIIMVKLIVVKYGGGVDYCVDGDVGYGNGGGVDDNDCPLISLYNFSQ